MLVAPTLLMRYRYSEAIDKRIANMWNVHKNRVDQGLGPTWSSSGYHESMDQDHACFLPNNHWNLTGLTDGVLTNNWLDNPLLRWHTSLEKYPSHFSDMDDNAMHTTDEYERFKKYKAHKKDVEGSTAQMFAADDDEKFSFYDSSGESPFTNPPDPN